MHKETRYVELSAFGVVEAVDDGDGNGRVVQVGHEPR
jgi:hypothetical protein